MESFMNGAMVVEAVLLSFFMALWMTWLSLRGLFLILPGKRTLQPVRIPVNAMEGSQRHNPA